MNKTGCGVGSDDVKSISNANGTVSSASLLRGTEGVDVSSRDILHHVSGSSSAKLPTIPISQEEVSLMKRSVFIGFQFLTIAENSPGPRSSGLG